MHRAVLEIPVLLALLVILQAHLGTMSLAVMLVLEAQQGRPVRGELTEGATPVPTLAVLEVLVFTAPAVGERRLLGLEGLLTLLSIRVGIMEAAAAVRAQSVLETPEVPVLVVLAGLALTAPSAAGGAVRAEFKLPAVLLLGFRLAAVAVVVLDSRAAVFAAVTAPPTTTLLLLVLAAVAVVVAYQIRRRPEIPAIQVAI